LIASIFEACPMQDDPMLKALAKAAQEADPLGDPRWEALAEGRLSQSEADALAAAAEASPELKEIFEAFRPLDDAARARIADGVLAGVKGDGAAPGARSEDEVPIAGAPPPVHRASPAGRRRPALAAAALVVALVASAFWISTRDEGPLPAYAIVVTGQRDVRSATDAPRDAPRLGPGSRLEITLRPATAARGPVSARGFLVRAGRARPWDAPTVVAEGGAVRVHGTREALFPGIEDGPLELVLAVGRPDALPSADEVTAELNGGRPPSGRHQLLRSPIVLASDDGAEKP
jgi:hypothetical protein